MIGFIARVLLSLPFVLLGWEAYQEPGRRVQSAEKIGVPEPELAVKANGLTMVAAGIAMALGIFPRLSALTLIGSLVPTTYAGHRFWEFDETAQRTNQRIHFLKNISMIGGLLAVVAQKKKD
jgi:putative oxidoreductase